MWFQYHVAKVKFFNVCPICIIKFHNIWVKNGMLRIKYSFIWKRIILLNIAIFQILSFKVVISWYWQNNTLMWEWSEVVCERFGSFNQKEKIILHSKFRQNTDLSVHSVEKSSKTRSPFSRKNYRFFRQINGFTKEVTNEWVSRKFLSVIAFYSTFPHCGVQRKKIRQINWGVENLSPFLKISWKNLAE